MYLLLADKKCAIWYQYGPGGNSNSISSHAGNGQVDAQAVYQVVNSTDTEPYPASSSQSGQQTMDRDVCVWDYHVVLLTQHSTENGSRIALVWDVDSKLDFPTELTRYAAHAFKLQYPIRDELRPQFRIVTSARFQQTFSSDRSHMIDSEGNYVAKPPTQPCIQSDPKVFSKDESEEVTELQEKLARHNLHLWTDIDIQNSVERQIPVASSEEDLMKAEEAFGICMDVQHMLQIFQPKAKETQRS